MKFYIISMFVLGMVFGPLATIWSINTLFQTEIAFTSINWIAVMWLQLVILAGVKR
jgi:hypothetical protein